MKIGFGIALILLLLSTSAYADITMEDKYKSRVDKWKIDREFHQKEIDRLTHETSDHQKAFDELETKVNNSEEVLKFIREE